MKTKSILLTILCFALIVLCACNGKKKSHDGQDMPVSEMKGEAMGMPIATEVIKIEPITPPADKFEVPADVEIMEY